MNQSPLLPGHTAVILKFRRPAPRRAFRDPAAPAVLMGTLVLASCAALTVATAHFTVLALNAWLPTRARER